MKKLMFFSSQLGMIKCSEISHFSIKYPSEGEFWQKGQTGVRK